MRMTVDQAQSSRDQKKHGAVEQRIEDDVTKTPMADSLFLAVIAMPSGSMLRAGLKPAPRYQPAPPAARCSMTFTSTFTLLPPTYND